MTKVILKRLLQILVLLVGISLLNFLLFRFTPGDAANQYMGPGTDVESLEKMREQMGADLPWYLGFGQWWLDVLDGNLGHSWSQHRPVFDILKESIPATLMLTSISFAFIFMLGALLGLVGGIYANKWQGKLLDSFVLLGYSLPSFWLALLLIFIFSIILRWLPPAGMASLFLTGDNLLALLSDRLLHLIMPVTVLSVIGAAGVARYMRGKVESILTEGYFLQARAKGLPAYQIHLKYTLRNALGPLVTLAGLYFPFLLSGAFIVEVIFAWPGIGRVAYEAIFSRDLPLLMAINFLAAIMVMVGNLSADILYKFIDPRIRSG